MSKKQQRDEIIPEANANENYAKTNENQRVSDLSIQRQSDENIPSKDENDLQEKDNFENNFSIEGDITVPGISENDGDEKKSENTSPREGKYNLRPNPTPNYTDDYRY